MSALFQFAILLQFAQTICGYVSKTRVSAVDVWRNDSGDGEVRVLHGINSWPALLEQLNGFGPMLERSAMIEGDVFMYHQRKHKNRAIPLMSTPQKVTDRITFKEWLREVAKLRKVIKINIRSTATIRPVLQYLFAINDEISSPVILHANIFRSPRSSEIAIDATEFIDGAQRFFPDATISFGWTKSNLSQLTEQQINIDWSELLKVLAIVKDIDQAVMIVARLSSMIGSSEQLSFLLGVRPTISALIWSDETDRVDDWSTLISLRSGPYAKRLVFDLHAKHQAVFNKLPYAIHLLQSMFNRNHWRLVEFPTSSSQSSGAIESDDGIALFGKPSAFLISLMQPPIFPDTQRIAAQVIFIKRKRYTDRQSLRHTGLAIYLLEKVLDLQSPEIETGIKVFVGCDGRLLIENRNKLSVFEQDKSVGQADSAGCYSIQVIDRGWRVELSVTPSINCEGSAIGQTKTISLDAPLTRSRVLRNVIVSKTGDSNVDLIVRNLQHNSCSCQSRKAAILNLLLICLFNIIFFANQYL